MTLADRRGIKSSKGSTSQSSSRGQTVRSDRERSERRWDSKYHLGYRAGNDGGGDHGEGQEYLRYREPSIRQDEQTELEFPRAYDETSAEITRPSYGSIAGPGNSYYSTEPGRSNLSFQSPGPYQSPQYQSPPYQTSPTNPYQASRPMSPNYDSRSGFPASPSIPNMWIPNMSKPNMFKPNTSTPNTTRFPYANDSHASSSRSEQPLELDSASGSAQLQNSIAYGYPMPGTQYQFQSKPIEKNSSAIEDSAQDEDLDEQQDEAGYMTIRKPGAYFKPGRIFRTTTTSDFEDASEDVKTFVVLQEGRGAAVCAPLQPYEADNTGYASDGDIRPLVLATSSTPQFVLGKDQPRMGQYPVFVEGPSGHIDLKSRLDLNTIMTVEHNVKVQNVGRIDRNYIKELKSTFSESIGETNSGNTSLEETQDDRKPLPLALRRLSDVHSTETNLGDVYESMTFSAEKSFERDQESMNYEMSKSRKNNTEESKLHLDFKVHHSREFKKGRLLKILWSEPIGLGAGTILGDFGGLAPAKYGENAYHSVRRFVIVKENIGHSLCIPILTYGSQATAKPGVHVHDHGIIYSGKTCPEQQIGERKLSKRPVRVKMFSAKDYLHTASRLNYSKLYTIEHNLRVCFIGKVHDNSKAIFFTEVKKALNGEDDEGETKKDDEGETKKMTRERQRRGRDKERRLNKGRK